MTMNKVCNTCSQPMFNGTCLNCSNARRNKQNEGPGHDPRRHMCSWRDGDEYCPMASGSGNYCGYHEGCSSAKYGRALIFWIKQNYDAILKWSKNAAELERPMPPKSYEQIRQDFRYHKRWEHKKTLVEQMNDRNPELRQRISECETAAEKMMLCLMAIEKKELMNGPIAKLLQSRLEN